MPQAGSLSPTPRHARGEFVGSAPARRFVLRHVAQPGGSRAVILVPPLAEEMNKCRRMLWLLGERLSAAGIDVELPDLFGTGDSDGDFRDARWSTWLDDVHASYGRLAARGAREVSLVAVRGGALLAAEAARRVPGRFASLVLWQPVTQGKALVTQLLRLRIAATALGRGASGQGTSALREAIRTEGSIEIAGYEFHSELVDSLEACDLAADPGTLPPVAWLEIVRDAGTEMSPAAANAAARLRAAGCRIEQAVVPGTQFWANTEIEIVPALIDRTVVALTTGMPS
jgi:exosortase A-associated hydrolase 2